MISENAWQLHNVASRYANKTSNMRPSDPAGDKIRGAEFLRTWIKNNVMTTDQGEARAAILATQCILEASLRGIPIAHLEDRRASVEFQITQAMASPRD